MRLNCSKSLEVTQTFFIGQIVVVLFKEFFKEVEKLWQKGKLIFSNNNLRQVIVDLRVFYWYLRLSISYVGRKFLQLVLSIV